MSTDPEIEQRSPVRKLTPEEERKQVRVLAIILAVFFVGVVGLVMVAAR